MKLVKTPFLSLLFATCFGLASEGGYAQSLTCDTLEIEVSSLNVRTGPSTGYSRVGTVNRAETYVVTGNSSGAWEEIWFNDSARWVYTGSYTSEVEVECGEVTASQLNVRSGPSTRYRKVGTVPRDSAWSIIGVNGVWRQIWYGSEARWVHGGYLDQTAPIPEIQITSFSINLGADDTYSRFASVSASYESSQPAFFRISEQSDFSDANWETYSSSIAYTLSAGEGVKTVYFQARNEQGRLSNVVADSIYYIEPTASGYEIDRSSFFSNFRSYYGSMDQSQVDGINFILANMEEDTRPAINSQTVWMRQLAYIFATTKHEVANTYQPITEYSNTTCVRYDGGCRYKGRGYVQLTHEFNYRNMSPVVGVDLVANPELALDPDIAYTVMSHGMFYGVFTGRALGDYILSGATDYYNARRVVNGLDRASLIQGYARDFQTILERSANRL